jgi:hypothetical protein
MRSPRRHWPSGFALMRANSLIYLNSPSCHQIEQRKATHGKSRLWRMARSITHKVIHSLCGQGENGFAIIELVGFYQIIPRIRMQLELALA